MTAPALLIALIGGVLTYGVIKYGPVYVDFLQVKSLVREVGQRAVMSAREEEARAWFDQRTAEEGFDWLSARSMLWDPVDQDQVDVGVRYEVQVRHLWVGTHRFEFSYYCTATRSGCKKFVPRW